MFHQYKEVNQEKGGHGISNKRDAKGQMKQREAPGQQPCSSSGAKPSQIRAIQKFREEVSSRSEIVITPSIFEHIEEFKQFQESLRYKKQQ